MRARNVEDLQVYQRARGLYAAVLAISAGFDCDFWWLARQINGSSESVMSNVGEGFRQDSDRAFARYLVIAASSAEETRSHLDAAVIAGQVDEARGRALAEEAREIVLMLKGLTGYLQRCDRKHRFARSD